MRNYWIKPVIALFALNLVLAPAAHAAYDGRTLFRHVGALVQTRMAFAEFLKDMDAHNDDLFAVHSTALVASSALVAGSPTESGSAVSVQSYGRVVVTAYSSSPDETDDTPFITASGTHTRDGIVAANFLPFGTKVRLPELFGDKVFVVEDRMNSRYTSRVDVWFPSKMEARQFGKQIGLLEIVEEI